MADYAVISNGVCVTVIVADADFAAAHFPGAIDIDTVSPRPGIGWSYDGTTWTAPAPPAPPAPSTVFERQAFMDLFTPLEIQACVNYATSLTATAPQKQGIAAVLFQFQSADTVDVTNPKVIAGVELLEAAGLLNTGRAAEILATTH